MKGDKIIINNKLVGLAEIRTDFDLLMEGNYIYAPMHTIDHKALHLSSVLELAERSYFALYGERFLLDPRLVGDSIASLLSGNRYPMSSAEVVLYLLPGCSDKLRELNQKPQHIISCRQQLLYRGYTNWHSGMRAMIVPYEYPFSQHRTAVSLSSHTYAQSYAKGRGADIAIRESYEGVLMGVGDHPLFAVSGNMVTTTPLACGATESIERTIVAQTIVSAGLELHESPLMHNLLRGYEELFYATPQGIHHVSECEGIIYPNIIARKVGEALSKRH